MFLVGTARNRKRSRWNSAAESNDPDYEGPDALSNGTQVTKSHSIEGRPKKGTSSSSGKLSFEKVPLRNIMGILHILYHTVDIDGFFPK